MSRHDSHLNLNEYGRQVPDKCHLALHLDEKKYHVKELGDDGKIRTIHKVPADDVLCWKDRAKTFGFAARHAQRQRRMAEKKIR